MSTANEYGRVNYDIKFFPNYINDDNSVFQGEPIDITPNVKSLVVTSSLQMFTTIFMSIGCTSSMLKALNPDSGCTAQIAIGPKGLAIPGWYVLVNSERILNEDSGIYELHLEFVPPEIAISPCFQRRFSTDFADTINQALMIIFEGKNMSAKQLWYDELIFGNPIFKAQSFWEYVQEANTYLSTQDNRPLLMYQKLNYSGGASWDILDPYEIETQNPTFVNIVNIQKLTKQEASQVLYDNSLNGHVAATDLQDSTYLDVNKKRKLDKTSFVMPQTPGFATTASNTDKFIPEIIERVVSEYTNYDQLGINKFGMATVAHRNLKELLSSGLASCITYNQQPTMLQPGQLIVAQSRDPSGTIKHGDYIILSTEVNTSNVTGFTVLTLLNIKYLKEFIKTLPSKDQTGFANNLRKDNVGK